MTTAVPRRVVIAKAAVPAAAPAAPTRPQGGAAVPFRAPAPPRPRPATQPDPADIEAARRALPPAPDDISKLPKMFVSHVQIAFLGKEEIIRNSVVEVFREAKGDAEKENTLFDPKMGISEGDNGVCPTCEQTDERCFGHYGYIVFVDPIINPVAMHELLTVLKVLDRLGTLDLKEGTWTRTYTDSTVKPFLAIPGPNRLRAYERRLRPTSSVTYQIKESEKANEVIYKYKLATVGGKAVEVANNTVPARTVLQILASLDDDDVAVMGFTEGAHPKHMVMEVMPVAPPCARPASEQDGKIWPDELTKAYETVLKANLALRRARADNKPETELQKRRKDINDAMIELMLGANKSVRERIQGKEAIPRAHLMSKRVDFSGRTVISPDPSLRFGQVRVPEYIAKTITWPERINALNKSKMEAAMRAGRVVRIYSAATKKRITVTDALRHRIVPELGDIYYRWLQDGDYVIVNRNPTLSRHSFQAMEAVIGQQMTFGLPLAYTTPYNADFDGDEMNIHVPQDPRVVAELKYLSSVTACLMSGSSNKNAMGVVFNSVTAAFLLTSENPRVPPELFFQATMLMTQRDQLATLDERLARHGVDKFTGRGLFSALLPQKMYYRRNAEPPVVVREGVLVSGMITKADIGPVSNSMVQAIWHQESDVRAAEFITDTVFVLDYWLTQRGYSIGASDCYPDDPAVRKEVQDHINEAKAVVASMGPKVGNSVLDDLTERRIVEKLADTNKLGVKILKATKTALTESIRAGTKGSAFNVAQTMASVGQQMLTGNRLEYQHPYFNPDDPSMDVNARGFIESSFMEGLNPAEFVALMAGGREGLIDTALNTADSGHLHHMVIKTAEDIKVDRRGMVTNSYGVIFQFVYGEDGLNPEHLQRVHTASGDALSFINISNEVARLNASFGYTNV